MRHEQRIARRRRRREGMTLIEIMIVVVIMAMVAAAAGVSVMNAKADADKKTAGTEVHNLGQVGEAYLLQDPKAECPTMATLRESRLLRRGSTGEDPWGTDYQLSCEDGEINVRSAGPDREFGTDDDIALFKSP